MASMSEEALRRQYSQLKKTAYQKIDLGMIEIRSNVREAYDESELDDLAANIKANGQLQPVCLIELPSGRFDVFYGHRRILALRKLGAETVLATVWDEEPTKEQFVAMQLSENILRTDLTDAEKAKGFKALIEDFGWTPGQIAEKFGKSYSWVYRYTSAADKAEVLEKAGIKTENLSANVLSKLPADAEAATSVAKAVIESGKKLTAETISGQIKGNLGAEGAHAKAGEAAPVPVPNGPEVVSSPSLAAEHSVANDDDLDDIPFEDDAAEDEALDDLVKTLFTSPPVPLSAEGLKGYRLALRLVGNKLGLTLEE